MSNAEIDVKIYSKLSQSFPSDHKDHRYDSISCAESSSLYLACQKNDLTRVELSLKKINHEEIDYQYPPNNETVLHVAVRNQNKEMIKILLSYGAQRSLRNIYGQQAHQLVSMQEIKDLFKRSNSSRFIFQHGDDSTVNFLLRHNTKCESCSLINDNTFYEWEQVDRNASLKALRFRHELRRPMSMDDKTFKQKLYSTNKGYLSVRLQDLFLTDSKRIHNYFKRSLVQQDPYYIVTAYTSSQSFSALLNTDMARNVVHDLKNGCSKFSCDCLYSTEDGTKAITSIFLRHPKFQKLSYKGEVYRGMIIPQNALDHYKVGSCIITTTFLSTSKNPDVARRFCDKGMPNPTTHSFFCIYEILNDDRTALDISTISEFEDEDEVLILPYSAFLITKIDEEQYRTYIYLKEQCLTEMFDSNGLHNMREYTKSTSQAMPELFTKL